MHTLSTLAAAAVAAVVVEGDLTALSLHLPSKLIVSRALLLLVKIPVISLCLLPGTLLPSCSLSPDARGTCAPELEKKRRRRRMGEQEREEERAKACACHPATLEHEKHVFCLLISLSSREAVVCMH